MLDVAEWCSTGALPEATEFYRALAEDDGKFIDLEGPTWDFKREWPPSLSSDYFGGISRLVCAFANTAGGLIVFGVDDADRTGGHNKIKVNIDKFITAFRQLTDYDLDYDFRSYADPARGDAQVLLVRPRRVGAPPLRLKRQIGNYPPAIIWVRSGHEVVAATPSHFPQLFCRAGLSEAIQERDGSIPPSPATMRRFVGRVEVLDRLFDWLENSDEPRTYLHGKGGSGKTTIAYEFARLIKDFGANLRIEKSDAIDAVIFLSAKERALVPNTGETETLDEPDFCDEPSLLRQILYYGNWTRDRNYLDSMDVNALRREVQHFLDLTSVLIVVDDVDTLTTKGIDPGSDYLYRALCRCSRRSRVLYTLRNAPSQSLLSSIEVPGLQGGDYELFVSECARQFGVKEPTNEFRDSRLTQLSERRPLVIESIVALVRTASSYDRAADLFGQHAGDNVRDYVFIREWDALAGDEAARLFLAALADFGRPETFANLRTVLQTDDSTIQDAIGKVREMFLHIDQAGDEVLYSLAPLTRSFINSRKKVLRGYARVTQRVSAFKRSVRITSPAVLAVVAKVQRLVPLHEASPHVDGINEAWRIVSDATLQPSVTEDPVFKSAFGYVCSRLNPPRLTEAREAFSYATSMRHEPQYAELRAWFDAQRSSGVLDDWCERIADIVINGRTYSETEKIVMLSRKATSMHARGRERMYTEPTDAQQDFQEALVLHLRVFRLNVLRGDSRADVSEEYARNTAKVWFDLATRSERPDEVFDRIRILMNSRDTYLDPIEEALIGVLSKLERGYARGDAPPRVKAAVKGLGDQLGRREYWLDPSVGQRLSYAVRKFEETLSARPKR